MRAGQRSSRIRIFGNTESKGTLASVKTAWTELGYEWGGFLPEYMTLRNYGAGEVAAGTREIHLDAYSAVQARHGLEVVDGPEDGTKWRAVSVDRSDPSMTRVRVEPFAGAFT